MQILYKSADLRRQIIDLFSDPTCRRVAIAAFVGDGAETYLPKPNGLHLVCWPKAGGTNPNALRKLLRRGARISFADSLHMKVYWAEDRGAIVTSANLSTNALGAGSLKEIGVLLPSASLDIDRIISSLSIRPIEGSELKRLDRLHKLFLVKNPSIFSRATTQSFNRWYESADREDWKLGWWNSNESGFSSRAVKFMQEQYQVSEPHWAQACNRGEFRKGDWMLSFRLTEKRVGVPVWMFVDFVADLTKPELKLSGYACEAVQIWPPNRYPARPFKIDLRFKKAFSMALRQLGTQKIVKVKFSKPSEQLLDSIYRQYHR